MYKRQTYAPSAAIPDNWLDWCRQELFVTDVNIHTAPIYITSADTLSGFVGRAVFKVNKGTREQLSLLHALGWLATYTGVGCKTSMGMGAVALLSAA